MAAGVSELRSLTHEGLLARYRGGSCPERIDVLDGDPAGIGIGLSVLAGGRLDHVLRRQAAGRRFVWHGKSFRSLTATEGRGVNRFAVGRVIRALPFRTSIAGSLLDGRPAIALDFGAAPVRDELREVLPGVFLGPTGVRLRGRYRQLAWFAIDTNVQRG
jgi:hypothetical protein